MRALFGKTLLIVVLLLATLALPVKLMAGNPIVVRNDASIQAQFKSANGVYIIRDVIDLKNTKLSIPQNCILKFEGGQLKNGSIVYNNTFLDGRYQIYCQCSGTLSNDVVEPHMYGARGDGKTDDSHAIQQSINSGKQVFFRRNTYLVEKPIVFDRQNFIVDFNFSILKKTNKKGIDYKYESYDFNNIPSVVLIKPYASNTSGHIVLKNLIIDGGKVNAGIHAVWCRNVVLDNVRIYGASQGLVYKGFTNTFRDITIWDSNEGFVILGGNATLFERCFTSNCGWSIENAKGFSLVACSSDDFNPCYRIANSNITMTSCTFESKGTGIVVKSSVLDISGDFESHIYDSTKRILYMSVSDGSIVHANGCNFHLSNYLKKSVPDSNLFEISDNSTLEIKGRVIHGNSIKVKKSTNGKMILNGKQLKNGNNLY